MRLALGQVRCGRAARVLAILHDGALAAVGRDVAGERRSVDRMGGGRQWLSRRVGALVAVSDLRGAERVGLASRRRPGHLRVDDEARCGAVRGRANRERKAGARVQRIGPERSLHRGAVAAAAPDEREPERERCGCECAPEAERARHAASVARNRESGSKKAPGRIRRVVPFAIRRAWRDRPCKMSLESSVVSDVLARRHHVDA